MSTNELRLWALALRYRIAYDDCNPEVGLGPTPRTLLRKLQNEAALYLSVEEENAVLARLEDH